MSFPTDTRTEISVYPHTILCIYSSITRHFRHASLVHWHIAGFGGIYVPLSAPSLGLSARFGWFWENVSSIIKIRLGQNTNSSRTWSTPTVVIVLKVKTSLSAVFRSLCRRAVSFPVSSVRTLAAGT